MTIGDLTRLGIRVWMEPRNKPLLDPEHHFVHKPQ
jgi:hypothetical protein